jgi:signal transduction histidine kinase
MVMLARRQERELRAWLYGPQGATVAPATLLATCEEIAAQVELDHELPVELVVVGDLPLDESVGALTGAVREAATNAAKHAGAERVAIYVEVEPAAIVAFVRDTGVGFEPRAVPPDRRGLCDSIVGRVTRVGGSAEVETAVGGGTEWELRVPRSRT